MSGANGLTSTHNRGVQRGYAPLPGFGVLPKNSFYLVLPPQAAVISGCQQMAS